MNLGLFSLHLHLPKFSRLFSLPGERKGRKGSSTFFLSLMGEFERALYFSLLNKSSQEMWRSLQVMENIVELKRAFSGARERESRKKFQELTHFSYGKSEADVQEKTKASNVIRNNLLGKLLIP